MPTALTINIGGGGDGLDLPLIEWEGGPDYYTVAQNGQRMTKAEAAGWSDPSFFPIAVWLSDGGRAADFAALGINTHVGCFGVAGQVASIKAAGMWLISGGFDEPVLGPQLTGPDSDILVGLLAHDEPELNAPDYSAYISDVTAIRAEDPDAFAFVNFGPGPLDSHWYSDDIGGGLKEMHGAARANDVVCSDTYVYTGPVVRGNIMNPQFFGPCSGVVDFWPGPSCDHDYVQKAATYGWSTWRLQQYFETSALQPVWNTVETKMPLLGNDVGRSIILYDEIKGAVWHSIIREARGIMYFPQNGFYGLPTDPAIDPNTGLAPDTSRESLYECEPELADAVAAINAKIHSLAPVINTQSYVWDFEATGVETMLKAHDGFAYIFAGIGLGGATGSKTFTLPPGVSGTSVEVVEGTGGPLTVTGGDFSYTFTNEYDILIGKVAI